MAVFKSEKQGTQTPNRPQSVQKPQRGFMGEILPVGLGIAGGVAGGELPIVGSALAGVGGAAGEAAQQGIEQIQGKRKGFDTGDIIGSGISSIVGEGIFRGATSEPAKQIAIKGLSFLSGYEETFLQEVFRNPARFVPGFQKGADFLEGMIRKSGDAIGKYSGKISAHFKNLMAPINKKAIQGDLTHVGELIGRVRGILEQNNITSFGPTLDIGGKASEATKRLIARTYKGFESGLEFSSQEGLPSHILKKGEQDMVSAAWKAVNTLKGELPNAQTLHSVLRTLSSLRDFEKAGGDPSRQVIGTMFNEVRQFVSDFHPELHKVLEEIAPSEQFLKNIRELIPQKSGMRLGDKEIRMAKNKLMNLFEINKEQTLRTAEQFGKESGLDIVGAGGGRELRAGGKPSRLIMNPLSITANIGRFVRFVPKEIAQSPVWFQTWHPIIQNLVKLGINDKTIRAVVQEGIRSFQRNQ